MKKMHSSVNRIIATVLVLACLLGLLPTAALAAAPGTITLTKCDQTKESYTSPALGSCRLHTLTFDYNGGAKVGFCADHGKGMGWSLEGQPWDSAAPISDPTVKNMMAYYYAHTTGIFTDEAHASGEDELWDAHHASIMNAWVQAVIWRYKTGTLNDPATASAEELMNAYNCLEGTTYRSIDDVIYGNTSFRDFAQYVLDRGIQGVWGNCEVYEYRYAGASTDYQQAGNVQGIIIGELSVTTTTQDPYSLTVKKVDATDPGRTLPGASFLVTSDAGFSKAITVGGDGTYTLRDLEASTYTIFETSAPEGYEIDPTPQYVTLPGASNTVTVTFMDTPEDPGEGTIRKVDADNPTKGLPGAVIKITGVDNDFVGTYTTGDGGYLTDVPWDKFPKGSFTAEEVTPPEGYTMSPDTNKVKQTFEWDGKTDVALVFENDAKVKVKLIKLDDSGNPLPGAVFNIFKDGQIVGTEATQADGSITVTDVTEGLYAFLEVSAPEPFARLTEPVLAYVDQATINGGGTVTVTATDKKLPSLTILKKDGQSGNVIPGTTFEVKAIDGSYHNDVVTGVGGKATLSHVPVGSFEVTEKSVPDPYTLGEVTTQTIYLGPGDNRELVFDNLKQPELTISKVELGSGIGIPGTVFTISGIDSDYRHDVTTGADGTVTLRVAPGSYRILEKSVPEPYCLPEDESDCVQTVSLNPGDSKELIFKNAKKPLLTLSKIDADSQEPIPNTVLTVKALDGTYQDDWKTGLDGTVSLRVNPGVFEVTEKSVPSPYYVPDKDADRTQTITLSPGDEKTLVFRNRKAPELTIFKENSITGEPIEHAKFHITYTSNGEAAEAPATIDYGTAFTDARGEIKVHELGKRLYPGEFTITEVEPADGFQLKEPLTQTVIIHGNESKTVKFQNTPLSALVVWKYDSITSAPVEGAIFQVKYMSGTSGTGGTVIGTYKTGPGGSFTVNRLKAGAYLVEELASDGDHVMDTAPQTAYISGKEQDVVQLYFGNSPKGSLLIKKISASDHSPLSDCEFFITDSHGTMLGNANGKFVTNSAGTILISNINPGTTIVACETRAKENYILDDVPQTATIKAGQTVTLEFRNQPMGNLVIKKMSSTTKEPLSDVVIRVTRTDGTVVGESNGEFRTDESGFIKIPVEPGGYIVQEVKSKPGFLLDDTPKTIEVKGPGTYNIELFNQPLGSLVIHKYSSLDRKTPLAGVQFKVTYAPGCVVDNENGSVSSNGIYYTGPDGTITINGIVGTVVITEQATIPGYTIDPETRSQTIVVNPDDVQHAYFYNSPKNTLIIEKYIEEEGSEHKPLKGVTFLVTDSSGAVVGNSNGEFISGEDGRVVIPDLEPGSTITAREVKVPEGVVLDGTPKSIKISDDRANILRFYNKKTGYLVVRKLDKISKEPLSGVEFELTYADGSYVDDAFGHLSSKGRFKTSDAGEIRVPVVGTIVVKEVKTLPTHVIDPATQIQTVKVNPADTQTITVYNEPLCSLTLRKLDAVTGKPVPNTEFTLKDGDGKILGRYTTGADGTVTVTGLVPNSTVVVFESKVPSNYVLDPTPRTIIVRNGSNSVSSGGGNTGTVGGGGNDITIENIPKTTLTIKKYLKTDGGNEPLKGVTFLVTDSSGEAIGPDNGEYTTDRNGRIVIPNLEPGITVTAQELRVPEGVVLDPTPKSIKIKGGVGGQTLTFINKSTGGLELIKVSESDRTQRIPNVKFEIRRINGGLVDTVTTGRQGRVYLALDKGDYYAVETETAQGFQLDSTPIHFTVQDGKTTTLTVTNKAFSAILIHKTDSVTGKGIPGAVFLLYDAANNPIGQYSSDNNGNVYIENLTFSGRCYLRELKNDGYIVDTELKTVYLKPGETTEITWQNTPILAQIQIIKKSADYNPTNGLPAGTLLEGATFEIYNERTGNKVDTIVSGPNGLAVSQPLPLGRYQIFETKAPVNYSTSSETYTAVLEYSGQIVKMEISNKSLLTGVSIEKTGPREVMSGQPVRYVFSRIGNTSNVMLQSFYWKDTLPAAVQLDKVVTGTYNFPGTYKIVYKVNGTADYRTLADNLSTTQSYALAASPVALGLASNERVTEIMFVFGQVPAGFAQVEAPILYCTALPGLAIGSSFVNVADVGGTYNGVWVQAVTRWVTKVYGKPTPLPRTGY